jgi:hypothetical protein
MRLWLNRHHLLTKSKNSCVRLSADTTDSGANRGVGQTLRSAARAPRRPVLGQACLQGVMGSAKAIRTQICDTDELHARGGNAIK